MHSKHILVSSIAAVALGLAGAAFAETEADAAADAAAEIATGVAAGQEASQQAADVADEAQADVQEAQAAGEASTADAVDADLADEEANTIASDMIEAKEITKEVEEEAKVDAVLQDSKTLIEGQ
jgi:hypothetical protein